MKRKIRKISHLPDGHRRLEHAMSSFWMQNGIEFPWSFNLYLYCCNGAGVHCYGNDSRKTWMRERHGEAAESLRASTRAAFMREGR